MPNEPRVPNTGAPPTTPFNEAAEQLQEAVRAKKCWPCGCFHDTVAAIDVTFPAGQRLAPLDDTLRAAGGVPHTAPVRVPGVCGVLPGTRH